MKIPKKAFIFCIVLVAVLTLVGCAMPVATITSKPSETSTPTFLPSPYHTRTPSRTLIPFPSTPTLLRTLPPDREQQMAVLLQADDCKLPCYLGITPGKTTLGEAKKILENLGASYLGEYKRKSGEGIEYTYEMVIGGQTGADETPMPDGSIWTLSQSISLISNDDIVQIINASPGTIGPGISTTQAKAKFREYWSRYTAREIFLQNGPPDQLYVGKIAPTFVDYGSNLLIVYEKLGAVIDLYGTGLENNICPENEAKTIDLRLTLFNKNSPLNKYYDRVPPTDRSVWLPIEEVLGVNPKEFYNSVISNPSICFEPKILNQ
jgi:hypothetical protein